MIFFISEMLSKPDAKVVIISEFAHISGVFFAFHSFFFRGFFWFQNLNLI